MMFMQHQINVVCLVQNKQKVLVDNNLNNKFQNHNMYLNAKLLNKAKMVKQLHKLMIKYIQVFQVNKI